MITNLSLDEMILQYSENPFIDDTKLVIPSTYSGQKHKILTRLLLIAGNLFNKEPETVLDSYKRRYGVKQS